VRLVRWAGVGVGVAASVVAAPALAVDVGVAGGNQAQLDVTESTIVAQHFDARDNEAPSDSGWGTWINRLDAALRWGSWTAGLRLDSAVYWRRPVDNPDFLHLPVSLQNQAEIEGQSQFQNSIYPAKLWLNYSAPGLEVTVGDAYAQFGRGLTLSMRKIDELGIDTTVRGIKVQAQQDPFAVTAIAGFGNPSRVDEATGRDLFPTTASPSAPMFGSDRILGLEVQAGRGLPVTLATHVVRYSRCAPYHYDADGRIVTNFFDDPSNVTFGSCNASDTAIWLASLPNAPTLRDSAVTLVGQSLEVPTLAGHGKLYIEVAGQQRQGSAGQTNENGNALYAAFSTNAGPVSGTLEIKSNRNFYPVFAGINQSAAPEFNVVAYSFVPPAETPTILDSELGYFNACVNGGRLRSDVRVSDRLLVYGQGIFDRTQSEDTDGGCDAQGRTVSVLPAAQVQDTVWDGLGGFEWMSPDALSHAFVSAGVRDDTKDSGDFTYRERHLEYSIVEYLGMGVAIEAQGFHRMRKEEDQNSDRWWNEGENYIALKVAPSWVLTQGFEYTTLTGQPTTYFNGALLYKFTSSSNIRLFVGQQRGAYRCASGVCRYFPPFEGARAEVTWRF
jgi:Family of unknown function (DUF6029)